MRTQQQQNQKPKSPDFASQVDEACTRLEHVGKTMQSIAAEQRKRPAADKDWMALRDATLLMSSLSHILSEFARIYWRTIPADLRTAPVPADYYPPVAEVRR